MVWAKRIGAGLAALLVLLLIVTLATGTTFARRGFPTTSGDVEVAGLDGDVEVRRDAYGVPTIVASTSADLFRAQGYVHAQDRFWEMDMRRHVTGGRVAELFGADQLDTDRFVRTLGWRRVAEQELERLEDDTLAMLEAYADGVNAWMEGRSGSRLSFEHALLPLTGAGGYEPEPWTPADSVAWLKAMAWDLRTNLEDELMRGRLAGVDLGEGRSLDDLYPDFPADRHPPILTEGGEVEEGRWEPAPGTDGDAEGETASPAGAPPTGATDHLGVAADGPADVAVGAVADRSVDGSLEAAFAAAQEALAVSPQMLGDGAGEGLGSNSWVIAPERSTTGAALLANDPHLGPSLPSIWHQVGLRCEPVGPHCPYHVAGFSFSGLPGIAIGHNDRVAWGVTNLGADVADLVVERIDGDRYLTEDGWEELEVTTDVLRVAGGDDEELTIRATRNGPLFSDVSEAGAEVAAGPLGREAVGAHDERGADEPASAPDGADDADGAADADEGDDAGGADGEYAVALRWVALEPTTTMDAIPRFMQAQDWETFREAASRFDSPSQNLVYADVEGRIGYQAPGRIPVRRTGDGTVPLPGWTGEFGWDRFYDFEELPWALDPDEGYLATANQPVLPPGTEPFLSEDHNLGHRAARIDDLLTSQERFSPDDLLAMQSDNHNANAAQLVPVVTDLDDGGDERVREVQQVLVGWDLQDDVDASGGAAFNATWRHLLELTFATTLPGYAEPDGSGRWWEVVRRLVEDPDSAWWDPPGDGPSGRDDLLRAAMAAAHDELTSRLGDDPDGWRWGELHTLPLTHQTFGESGIAPLEWLFNRGPLETAGGSDIVNATGWNAAEGYEVGWVPSMRMVIDMGDLDDGRWVHLTGQSGRPFHRHYTDQAETWRDGGAIPIAFGPVAVEEATEDLLVLRPAD